MDRHHGKLLLPKGIGCHFFNLLNDKKWFPIHIGATSYYSELDPTNGAISHEMEYLSLIIIEQTDCLENIQNTENEMLVTGMERMDSGEIIVYLEESIYGD